MSFTIGPTPDAKNRLIQKLKGYFKISGDELKASITHVVAGTEQIDSPIFTINRDELYRSEIWYPVSCPALNVEYLMDPDKMKKTPVFEAFTQADSYLIKDGHKWNVHLALRHTTNAVWVAYRELEHNYKCPTGIYCSMDSDTAKKYTIVIQPIESYLRSHYPPPGE